jgi:chaperone BCS1
MDQTASDAVSTQVPSIGNGNKEDVIRQLAEAGVQGDGSIFAQLSSNPFFTAGFGLAALGAAMRYGSQGLRRGVELAKRRLLVDVEVTRHDESYEWVLNWMTAQFQHQLEPHALRRNVGITDPSRLHFLWCLATASTSCATRMLSSVSIVNESASPSMPLGGHSRQSL